MAGLRGRIFNQAGDGPVQGGIDRGAAGRRKGSHGVLGLLEDVTRAGGGDGDRPDRVGVVGEDAKEVLRPQRFDGTHRRFTGKREGAQILRRPARPVHAG